VESMPLPVAGDESVFFMKNLVFVKCVRRRIVKLTEKEKDSSARNTRFL
jgi:hypothetical protein